MSLKKYKKIGSSFKNKDILSLDQFTPKTIEKLFKATRKIIKLVKNNRRTDFLKGTVSTLLFFEPSSRTFSSFCVAVKNLGGQTIEYQNPMQTSSSIKGETLEDTIQVFENYSDIIVMRHFEAGAAYRASLVAKSALIINAGDGIGEHPTQALLDLFTLCKKFGTLNGLKGVIAGDLLNGRTVHSLLKGFSLYKDISLYLLSPKELRLQPELLKIFKKNGLKLVEIENEKEIPDDCNFWYWTRVQKERFKTLKDYEKVKNRFIITQDLLKEKGNNELIIMHPLPRVGEIDPKIDKDPRAVYLTDQVRNGMYVRMALLSLVLGRI